MNELDRRAAAVIRRVLAGEVAVVSRYGKARAVIVRLADVPELRPEEIAPAALEGLRELFAERARLRRISQLMHGRWWHGGGIHGTYPRSPGRRRGG